jgi:hypothetical protein
VDQIGSSIYPYPKANVQLQPVVQEKNVQLQPSLVARSLLFQKKIVKKIKKNHVLLVRPSRANPVDGADKDGVIWTIR